MSPQTLQFRRQLSLWLPVIVWSLVIYNFSAHTTPTTSDVHAIDVTIKKLAHIVEYAIFTLLLYRSYKGSGVEPKKALWYAFVTAVAYAITDELHQRLTPGRESSLRDVIIDTFGAGLAILCIKKLLPIVPKPLLTWAQKLELI